MAERSDNDYNPQDENFPRHPGGTTTRVMWNEKENLDAFVRKVAMTPKGASLPSNHDPFRMGVYGTTSVGDFD